MVFYYAYLRVSEGLLTGMLQPMCLCRVIMACFALKKTVMDFHFELSLRFPDFKFFLFSIHSELSGVTALQMRDPPEQELWHTTAIRKHMNG